MPLEETGLPGRYWDAMGDPCSLPIATICALKGESGAKINAATLKPAMDPHGARGRDCCDLLCSFDLILLIRIIGCEVIVMRPVLSENSVLCFVLR